MYLVTTSVRFIVVTNVSFLEVATHLHFGSPKVIYHRSSIFKECDEIMMNINYTNLTKIQFNPLYRFLWRG